MKKNEVVKDKRKFNHIINKGKYFKNSLFVIYIMKTNEINPHFGIAVSTKFGSAVERNKIKRRIRVLATKYKLLFPNYHDYIIMVRTDCKNSSFQDLDRSFKELLTKEINK